jgi:hypothetical protein
MPTFFIVRATVSNPAKRAAFDAGYSKEYLPDAVKSFGAQQARERSGGASGDRQAGGDARTEA